VFGFLGAPVLRTAHQLADAIGSARCALILGFFGFVARVDNFAHAGGFLGGYLAARYLDPLKPERIDHVVIALVCLGATLAAIAASFITALPMLLQQ
jgi:membrane associated rhomboid family serine protease